MVQMVQHLLVYAEALQKPTVPPTPEIFGLAPQNNE
jgi:hypothetical protein